MEPDTRRRTRHATDGGERRNSMNVLARAVSGRVHYAWIIAALVFVPEVTTLNAVELAETAGRTSNSTVDVPVKALEKVTVVELVSV